MFCTTDSERLEGVVECDETHFGYRKYYKGRRQRQGGQVCLQTLLEVDDSNYRRQAKRLKVEIAPDKKADTLLGNIEKHVKPSSRIQTDGLRAYRGISRRGYDHSFVNHSRSEWKRRGCTTNTVEGTHGAMKRLIRNQSLLNGQKIPNSSI